MAMQNQYNDSQRRLPGKRPRLMIDISPELRRRIKVAAARGDHLVTPLRLSGRCAKSAQSTWESYEKCYSC